jgi:hypothetical protein
VRVWFSGPRLFNGLVRPGISFGKEDFGPPRLPNWRRYELRYNLQEAVKAKGETMTKDAADYVIDKALAIGLIDRQRNLCFKVKGSRDACIAQIVETAAAWGKPMTHAEAAAKFDDEIDLQRYRRHIKILAIVMNVIGIWALWRAFT